MCRSDPRPSSPSRFVFPDDFQPARRPWHSSQVNSNVYLCFYHLKFKRGHVLWGGDVGCWLWMEMSALECRGDRKSVV